MTVAPEDQDPIWLKQVPRDKQVYPALWTQEMLENHSPIRQSRERPRETVDGPTLTRLLVAMENLYPQGRDLPADRALSEAMDAYQAYRDFEMHGKT